MRTTRAGRFAIGVTILGAMALSACNSAGDSPDAVVSASTTTAAPPTTAEATTTSSIPHTTWETTFEGHSYRVVIEVPYTYTLTNPESEIPIGCPAGGGFPVAGSRYVIVSTEVGADTVRPINGPGISMYYKDGTDWRQFGSESRAYQIDMSCVPRVVSDALDTLTHNDAVIMYMEPELGKDEIGVRAGDDPTYHSVYSPS